MKLILSRKGFDSQYGGIASPIMPNGDLLSIPIPEINTGTTYQSLKYGNDTYEKIIMDLGYKQEVLECHLDPDLYNIKNQSGWKAIFGQCDAAAGHLKNNKINKGDIFLFFGTFKEVELKGGKYKYKEGAKDKHIIYGYLQVGDFIEEGFSNYYWHPHANDKYVGWKNNIMFIASEKLLDTNLPGFGTLKKSDNLILTKTNYSKTKWELPDVLKGKKITYHSERSYKNDYFQSAYPGQEFVIDCDNSMEEWIKKLVGKNE
jgi:hypothetical protein